jgi:NAD(P)H-dependent FMN reductase
MKRLLVVWCSMTGGSHQMALALADAARAAAPGEVEVECLEAGVAGPAEVLAADAYAFVTPENLASMAGRMKDFFDRVYYAALDQVNGRPYAVLVCAGSDGAGAVRQIERIATGLRLRAVAPGQIVCTHAQTREAILAPKQIDPADLTRCAELGAALAAGLAAGVF